MEPDKPIELHPDAWERFEKAITTVAKAKPIHRSTKKKARARSTPQKP